MIKQIKNKLTKKNKRGFTLIELIVVIAIVAVLAAVGIPAIAGQVAKSKQSSADANAKLLAEQASIMLTQAETAGDFSKIKNLAGTDVTVASNNAGFLAAVAEAANVDTSKYTDKAEITLAAINDPASPSTQIGWRVSGVALEEGNAKGKFPLGS